MSELFSPAHYSTARMVHLHVPTPWISRSTALFLAIALSSASSFGQRMQERTVLDGPPSAQDRLFESTDRAGDPHDTSDNTSRRKRLRFDDRSQPSDKAASKDSDELNDDGYLYDPLYKDFSRFIRDATGNIVIDALALRRSNTLSPKLPEDYVLSSGDRVAIQVWGPVSADYKLTLDEAGRVFVPEVGSIALAGTKASSLQRVIQEHFSRVYRNFELNASLDTARATTIYVTGQAESLGLKTVPARHTIFSASLSFARPSQGGSRRFVDFTRGNGASQRFDLYCFFGQTCPDIPKVLQDGDVINVPPRAKLVAIGGAVARPGIYEVAPNETTEDLLRYAGGPSVVADTTNVKQYSFQSPAGDFTFHAVSLGGCAGKDASAQCPVLRDGDYFDVPRKLALVRNAVSVVAPDLDAIKLEFHPGMKLLDALRPPFYPLMPQETIEAVNAGSFSALSQLDEQLKALNFTSITIYRLDAARRQFVPVQADYKAASAAPNSPANVLLQEGDVVVLENSEQWRTRRQDLQMSVRVVGEVRHPGKFSLTGTRTLGEVIELAGGVTSSAAIWNAIVLRQSDAGAAITRQMLDKAIKSLTDYQALEREVNSDRPSPAVGLDSKLASQRAIETTLATETKGSKAVLQMLEGREIVYLGGKDNDTAGALVVQPYDIVLIPPQQDTYSCQGAFFRVGEFHVAGNPLSLEDALARCGTIEEMHPNIYHFVAKENRVCRKSWMKSCPKVEGGDLLVAVPEAVARHKTALDWLDLTLRSLTTLATLKILVE